MANGDTEDFTGNIIGVVIAVVVVGAVAIPIITGMVGENTPAQGTPGTDGYVPAVTYPINTADPNMAVLATIMEILPVFLVLAILMMIVYLFITKYGKN
jgi:hypothetical protein